MSELRIYNNNLPKEFKIEKRKEYISEFFHVQDEMELVYFTCDEWSVCLDEKSFSGGKDELMIINCNTLHKVQASEFIRIHLPSDLLSDINLSDILFKELICNDKTIQDFFHILANEENILRIKSTVYRTIYYLIKNYRNGDLNKAQHPKKRLIYEILDFMGLNYNKGISTKSIAVKFHLNKFYFCSFFKKYTGLSPVDYINRLRCERAANMLLNTDSGMQEIAEHSGFSSSNYFARTFKKITGKTPMEYRKSFKS